MRAEDLEWILHHLHDKSMKREDAPSWVAFELLLTWRECVKDRARLVTDWLAKTTPRTFSANEDMEAALARDRRIIDELNISQRIRDALAGDAVV